VEKSTAVTRRLYVRKALAKGAAQPEPLFLTRYAEPVRDDASLTELARAIAGGDRAQVSSLLVAAPGLALTRIAGGASGCCCGGGGGGGGEHFHGAIGHQVYAGDTALHIAAAAYEAGIARDLVELGALVAAANRRGAQPLHYAVDGTPGSPRWNPVAQQETVLCLVELGADPNAVDKNGTTPLHRAVRNRCAAAVKALLEVGADPRAANGRGSSAMQLARWTTGRGGSGSPAAREQQQEIVGLLRVSGST
jgi:Ankyrin repeats (many copies)